jgi:hypothetical protein
MKYTLNRDVTKAECPWLDAELKKGASVYRYDGCTYACISGNGVAVTLFEDRLPFFEIPRNAVTPAAVARGVRHFGDLIARRWGGR